MRIAYVHMWNLYRGDKHGCGEYMRVDDRNMHNIISVHICACVYFGIFIYISGCI